MTLLVFALASTALWYLGSRAVITQAIWSRYPPRFARFMDCPACTGFWWGVILTIINGNARLTNELVLDNPIVVGLCMIVLVAIFAGIMQRALWEAGSAADVEATPDE